MQGIDRVVGSMPLLFKEFGVDAGTEDAMALEACEEMLPIIILENQGQAPHFFSLVDRDGCVRLRNQLAWLGSAANKPWISPSSLDPPKQSPILEPFLSVRAFEAHFPVQCFEKDEDDIRILMEEHNRQVVLMKESIRATEAKLEEGKEEARRVVAEKWAARHGDVLLFAKQLQVAKVQYGDLVDLMQEYTEAVGVAPPMDPSVKEFLDTLVPRGDEPPHKRVRLSEDGSSGAPLGDGDDDSQTDSETLHTGKRQRLAKSSDRAESSGHSSDGDAMKAFETEWSASNLSRHYKFVFVDDNKVRITRDGVEFVMKTRAVSEKLLKDRVATRWSAEKKKLKQ